MLKLVIIDIDDTLILTEESCYALENKIVSQLGYSEIDRAAHRRNWGTPLREAIAERSPGIDVDAFIAKFQMELPKFVESGRLDKVSDENLAVLDKIRESGKRLAILTSREKYEMEHFLHPDHKLSRSVEAFFHRDNSDFVKPDPRVFDKILSHFKAKPSDAVYIGDTVNDAKCAKAAGLQFIAVLEGGIRKQEDFEKLSVDYFAPTFPDILDFLALK